MARFSQYITLPASASRREFPGNTLTEYTVRLAERLDLHDRPYEVALCSIKYPNSWYNVTEGRISLKDTKVKGKDGVTPQHVIYPIDLHRGRVTSVSDLLQRMHKAATSMKLVKQFSIFHEPYDNVATLMVQGRGWEVRLSDDLANIFGFEAGRWYAKGSYRAGRGVDISAGHRLMYVYSDIAENRPVGDVQVPLLRVVAFAGDRNEDHSVDFTRPQYVRAARKSTDLFKVQLATDTGMPIAFSDGNVSVTLHLREAS